jgi:alpha-L-fucosidase
MKKAFLIICVLLASIAVFAQHGVIVTSDEENQASYVVSDEALTSTVINPSFEDGTTNGYEIVTIKGDAEIAVTDEIAHQGEKSLKIVGKDASVIVSQNILLERFTVYKLTIWAKAKDLSGDGNSSVLMNGNSIDFINLMSEPFYFDDQNWERKVFYLNSGKTTVLNINIGFKAWGGSGNGTMYIDEIQLEKIAHTEGEYVINESRRVIPGVPQEMNKRNLNEWFGTMEGGTRQIFRPTVESLRQYKAPEWFRDAKFGIFIVWGVYSQQAINGDWFARHMYLPGMPEYEYMLEKFADQDEYGYKDIIDEWKAEKFDAEHMVQTFKTAGAKYIVPIAVHHDNFDLWDSRYHKWNAVNYGPKKDIIGLFRDATINNGLRFGVTTHLARTWSWFNVNKLSYPDGVREGHPFDGNDPEYEDLYLKNTGEIGHTIPINPDIQWRSEWACRITDLMNKYEPDLYYFDGSVPFRGYDQARTGLEVISYYYNENIKWNKGKNEAVMCIKQARNGYYFDGIATLDFERGHAKEALSEPWQTDDAMTLGAWCYTRNAVYQEPITLLHKMIDIVSKNGNYLLAVGPKGDGTLPQEVIDRLNVFGDWLEVNGEAIYETRPWDVAEEGDVRFTQSKDGENIYAITLSHPQDGKLNIKSLNLKSIKVNSIQMLGYRGKLKWKQTEMGLTIIIPEDLPCEHAWSFKINI